MKLKDFLKEIEHEYKYTECDVEDYELKVFIRNTSDQDYNSAYLPITKYEVDSHKKEVRFLIENSPDLNTV